MACFPDPSSIPRISELHKILGYANSEVPGFVAFHDAYQAFHKTFFTKHDRKGTTLHDWQNREHRRGLLEMAREFLGSKNHGKLFWSVYRAGARKNKLRYPRDKIRIEQYLQYLFWRLGEQQDSKTKTKISEHKTMEQMASLNERGRTYENPIYVDDDGPQEVELIINALYSTVLALEQADRIPSSAVVRIQGSTDTGVQQPAITNPTTHTASAQLSTPKADCEINWYLEHRGKAWRPEKGYRTKTLPGLVLEHQGAPLRFKWSEVKFVRTQLTSWNERVVMVFSGGEEARFVWVILATHIIMGWQAETPDEEDLFVSLEFESSMEGF
ncbi:hypothetical protein Landi51_13650 [Colletotrichum acutatum]